MNPFSIDICKSIASIEAKIMLIYSKDDSIVSCSHSMEIGKHCRKNPIELEIKEDHNKPRSAETYIKALYFIQNSIQYFDSRVKRSRSRGRGISVSSKENTPQFQNGSTVRRSLCSSNNSDKLSILNDSKSKKYSPNLGHVGAFNSTYKNFSPSSYTDPTLQNTSIIKSVILQTHESSHRRYQNSIKLKTLQKYKGILA